MNTFLHLGDLGDAIAALPSIRSLGGGNIIFGPHTGEFQGREVLRGGRFEAIKPLLEAQPYIKYVTWQEKPKKFTHDMTDFRKGPHQAETLLELQAMFLGVKPNYDPWLQCMRSPVSLGRTVIARSPRYHNIKFPWNIVMYKYRNALFVGSKGEHEAFERAFGRIEFHPTPDLLALAEIIAGASLFIGNQSCPFWIAAGLGVNLIQESWANDPNSIVRRPNARYLLRGPLTI